MRKVFLENTDPNNFNYNASIKLLHKIIQTTYKAREKFAISANCNSFFALLHGGEIFAGFSPGSPQPNKTLNSYAPFKAISPIRS